MKTLFVSLYCLLIKLITVFFLRIKSTKAICDEDTCIIPDDDYPFNIPNELSSLLKEDIYKNINDELYSSLEDIYKNQLKK